MKVWINSIVGIACLGALVFTGAWLRMNIKTEYAPGYSAAKFRTIRAGMSDEDVTAILGTPVRMTTQYWSETWTYDSQTNSNTNTPNGQFEFEWRVLPASYTYLWFSPSGTVAEFKGTYLKGDLVGLEKTQVLASFGYPAETNVTKYVRVFHYSRSPNSSSYLFRNVYFDISNRVESREAGWYFD